MLKLGGKNDEGSRRDALVRAGAGGGAGRRAGIAGRGFSLPPLFLAVVGLACAAHRPSRAFVTDKLGEAFGGGRIRSLVIVAGAILMIQILPLELALLMAGDVLAYVEVVAAVSLIAGQARWLLFKARAGRWVQAVVREVWRRPAARSRRPAPRHRPARPAANDDEGRAPWGWALA